MLKRIFFFTNRSIITLWPKHEKKIKNKKNSQDGHNELVFRLGKQLMSQRLLQISQQFNLVEMTHKTKRVHSYRLIISIWFRINAMRLSKCPDFWRQFHRQWPHKCNITFWWYVNVNSVSGKTHMLIIKLDVFEAGVSRSEQTKRIKKKKKKQHTEYNNWNGTHYMCVYFHGLGQKPLIFTCTNMSKVYEIFCM